MSQRPARLARCVLTLAALALLAAAAPTPASAARHELRPTSVRGGLITFRLTGIEPRSVRSATLRTRARTRRIGTSRVRAAARSGLLALRWPPRSARSARSAPRRLSEARLIVITKPVTRTPPAGHVTPITGTTYYVSSTGSDGADGRSVATAWRSVGKVNSAALRPGDGVLFEGGATFAGGALSPAGSGTASNPIVYGAYGAGKAAIPQGIYLESVDGLAFQNLSISGPAQGVLASSSGDGVEDVTLERLAISDVGIAIDSANWGDANWKIAGNRISSTGDSGLILLGSSFAVTSNTISDTGTDSSIAYAKHAIYLKVVDANVTYNTITRPGTSAISVRYRNSVIEHNVISGGDEGIAWFQYDDAPGTSYWRYNTISDTSGAAIYVSPADTGGPTRESFVIAGNTLSRRSGQLMDLQPTSGTYTLSPAAQ